MLLTIRFLTHDAITGKSKDDVVAQSEECNYYMNHLGNKSRLLASLILGEDDRSEEQAKETSVWESLNLLQAKVSKGQEEMKEVQDGLEKLLGMEEKEVVTPMGKNLEKLAKAFKRSMMAINSRLVLVEVKVSKLAIDDQAADYKFNPMLAFDATAWSDVDERLSRIQDKVQVLEDRPTAQGVANGGGGRVSAEVHKQILE